MSFRARIVDALKNGARDARLLRKQRAFEASTGHDTGDKRDNNGESGRIHVHLLARLM
jgi:hypothetical protein